MKDYLTSAEKLIDMLGECTCSYTTVTKVVDILKENNFIELNLSKSWDIVNGGKYYINIYDSGIFAFTIGERFSGDTGVRIVAAHTDHPCMYIKPNPEVIKNKYASVNVEMYGGMILNTWLDRPLSMAGKVTYKSDNMSKPNVRIIDMKKSVFTIPNLAIHQNREVNKGMELSRQKDMMPVCATIEEMLDNNHFFIKYLAKHIDVSADDILDYEIYIYNNDIPEILGLNDDFISSPRLDNITSVLACTEGIVHSGNIISSSDRINVMALFDNEEIGSRTKQGADCSLLSIVLEKLYYELGYERIDYLNGVMDGFCLSVDVAHGEHPNKLEKSDITNKNPLNSGVVIKRACSQTYATDATSIAFIEQICSSYDIPYQKFTSNSDITTGSTLGDCVNKYLPMRTVDLGVPVLAMHSARETMGSKDQRALTKLIKAFIESC